MLSHIKKETKAKTYLVLLWLLFIASPWLLLNHELLENFTTKDIEILIVGFIILVSFVLYKSIKILKSEYKVIHYIVPFVVEIIACIFLIFSVSKSCLVLRIYYLFLWEFVIIYLGVAVIVPFSYKKSYIESNIGSFYSIFSNNSFNLEKTIKVIYNNDKLKCFLTPWADMKKRENHGEIIVSNLQLLKKQNISAYNRLLNRVEENAEPKTFINLLAIAISFISVVISLWNNKLFDGFKSIFEKQGYNVYSYLFDCFIAVIFILIVINTFSLYVENENRQFYKEISLFFEETKK